MKSEKVSFKSTGGQVLAGRLELPGNQNPGQYAVFAHCFTCSKDLKAAREITRALSRKGFGVLRFDFTGLGGSEGDFSASNFSGNIEDLISAADFLSANYSAPTLLVGHSLGGAACLKAAFDLSSVQAVVTIGTPSSPKHVVRHFEDQIETIRKSGSAEVSIGGRPFRIRKQFLEDLEKAPLATSLNDLKKALLIMHSPQDQIVGIENAETLYKAARHPKSFVSLDGADHLLSEPEDAVYAGQVIGAWAARYLPVPGQAKPDNTHEVVAGLERESGFTTEVRLGRHNLTADEPESFGGNDLGPSPYQFLSAGLAACTVMTLQMYAKRKGWDLQHAEVHMEYTKDHARDTEKCEDPEAKIDTFQRKIRLIGDLDDQQRQKLMEIADKCPVHRTLHSPTQVLTEPLDP